jgi:hypothetical protein
MNAEHASLPAGAWSRRMPCLAALPVTALLAIGVPSAGPASAATIQLLSISCAGDGAGNSNGQNCNRDLHTGSLPQASSTSRTFIQSTSSGGANLAAENNAFASFGGFAMFSFAGATLTGDLVGRAFGATGSSLVRYTDTLNIPGTGTGTLRVPWRVDGGIDTFETNAAGGASVSLGFPFCQSFRTATSTGASGCTRSRGNTLGSEVFTVDTAYDELWFLDFAFEFGVDYTFITDFALGAGAGGTLGSSAQADFTHTGEMQPVQVFDSLGNLIANPTIVAESGLNYLDPQAAVPPDPEPTPTFEPATASVLGFGLATLLAARRRHSAPESQRKVVVKIT